MAGWRDLPNELTTHVLRLFASEEEIKVQDLVDVLSVCRRFRAIMEPLIYTTPNVRFYGYTATGDDDDPDVTFASLRRFARTIISRPNLGRLVKEISISLDYFAEYTSTFEETTRCCSTHFDIGESEAIIASLSSAAGDDIRVLASAATAGGLSNGLILRGDCPGLLIFLLHHLPSLKSLSIGGDHEITIVVSAALGRIRGGVPIGLRSITSLKLSYNDWKYGLDSADVIPFMTLPALTKLECYKFEGDGGWNLFSETKDAAEGPGALFLPSGGERYDSNGQDDPGNSSSAMQTPFDSTHYLRPQSSAITHLQFDNSSARFGLLGRILALPRRLESFRLDIGMERDRSAAFEPILMYNGLCTQKDSLKELVITSEYSYLTGSYPTQNGLLGSLSTFTQLQHLKIPASALLFYGRNETSDPMIPSERNPLDLLLPPSLIRLEADIEDERWVKKFVAMTGLPDTLEATSQSLPELRIFAVTGIGSPKGLLEYPCEGRLWPDEESWSVGHNICLIVMADSGHSSRGDEILDLYHQSIASSGS